MALEPQPLFSEAFFERNKLNKDFLFNDLGLARIQAGVMSNTELKSYKIINSFELEALLKDGVDDMLLKDCLFDPRILSLGQPENKNALKRLSNHTYKETSLYCSDLTEAIRGSRIAEYFLHSRPSSLFVHYRLGDIAAIPDIFTHQSNLFYFRRLDKPPKQLLPDEFSKICFFQ